ncbi:MAG TPA: thioredoxin-like domain-containing protein [Balneolaceae bacterium]
MKLKPLFIAALAAFTVWGCSSNNETQQAVISGKITVADSVDTTGNFSGIGLTVIKKDSVGAAADTLFHAVTDSSGTFSGTAHFREKRQYPLIFSRNGRNLGRAGVILAENDSVKITGELPGLGETLSITSHEHEAMDVYQNVNENFQRVMLFVRAGRITGDTLRQEILKWSNLFWEVYNEKKGTIASEMAAFKSIRLLQGWNNEKMMERIRSVQSADAFAVLAANYGKNHIAQSKGLDLALAYLDTLSSITQKREADMSISMQRIKLLYDSARVDAARKALEVFKTKYGKESSVKNWVQAISYDLNYLSPGSAIPDFQFTQNGKIISSDSLLGTPYILEITSLKSPLYQQQFDRTVVIHSIYQNYGLEVITLPLDQSQVTIDAFFNARLKPWPVASAQSFEREKLLEKFNIQLIPTRFLVDENGKIVRKYVGREYEDVISGIQKIIKQEKEPAS